MTFSQLDMTKYELRRNSITMRLLRSMKITSCTTKERKYKWFSVRVINACSEAPNLTRTRCFFCRDNYRCLVVAKVLPGFITTETAEARKKYVQKLWDEIHRVNEVFRILKVESDYWVKRDTYTLPENCEVVKDYGTGRVKPW